MTLLATELEHRCCLCPMWDRQPKCITGNDKGSNKRGLTNDVAHRYLEYINMEVCAAFDVGATRKSPDTYS